MEYIAADISLNTSLERVQRIFYRRIIFYQILVVLILVLAAVLFIKFFSPLIVLSIIVLIFSMIFIIVEIVKNYRLRRLMFFLEELIDNRLYVHAYYLINSMKSYFSGKWLDELAQDIHNLAGLSSDEELIFNSDLYDKEIDNIISLIDFNIDIYKDFYLHNKLAVDSYGQQLRKIDDSLSTLNEIYNEQKKMLEVEKVRLEAFEGIKKYFQRLKKEQIKQMFNIPQVINLDKDYGRFINQLLDRAVYSAEARRTLNKIFKAKSRFYEIFSDILKAKSGQEIKEKLNYLFSE